MSKLCDSVTGMHQCVIVFVNDTCESAQGKRKKLQAASNKRNSLWKPPNKGMNGKLVVTGLGTLLSIAD